MNHLVTRSCWAAALWAAPLLAAGQSLDAVSAPYWQQEVAYRIQVQLDDKRHELRASEELTYTNHSPDRLEFIWFHLWPNAYRDRHTAYARQQLNNGSRTFQFAADTSRGYIDELSFTVDGAPAQLEYDRRSPDMAKLILPKPLSPGASALIRTPFRVKLPFTFSRGGHMGQSYQITQWYPKPAVYDRGGWHPMPYLDQGEFYSEYGSFDVSITLPANYVVGATGELQNPAERAFLDSLADVSARRVATEKTWPRTVAMPPSSPRTKTLRYVQDHVHDFAWFADKRYMVLKSGVTLPQSGRRVTTWLMFTPADAKQWLRYRGDIDAAILGYSRLVGDYPYSAATAVAGPLGPGTGGMEYPMITITEPSAIVHEVGHNWFYGILGTNERDYPWMDEGVNSYTENRVKDPLDLVRREATRPTTKGQTVKTPFLDHFGFDGLPKYVANDIAWQVGASRGLAQPVGGRSESFRSINYGTDVYVRTPALLRYLAAYLGQAQFDSCMHAYYRTWQFRHPLPADMMRVFQERSGKDLAWFFRDQIMTAILPDVGIDKLHEDDSLRVRVINQGDSLITVPVATLDANGKILHETWTPLFRDQGVLALPSDPATASVVVDPRYILPTVRRADDRLKLKGAFRSWNPAPLKLAVGPERWDRSPLYWAPALGVNTSDKFMLGIYLSNSALLQRRLRFTAVPLYSFNRNEVNGLGEIAYTVLGAGSYFSEAQTAVKVARFQQYLKVEPSLSIRLRQATPQSAKQLFSVGLTLVRRDKVASDSTSGELGGVRWARYEASLGNALQRFAVAARFENYYVRDLSTRQGIEPTNRFDGANILKVALRYERYYSRKKAISVRTFTGYIFGRPQDFFVVGLSNSPDYLRETAFLDRSQISRALQAGPRQTDDRDGGFHAWVPAVSNRWLATAALEAQLPKVPLALYGEVGALKSSVGPQRDFYGAGLVIQPFGEILRFYVPIAGTNYSNDTPASLGDLSSNIRFSLHLDKLNPEHIIRSTLGQ